MNGSKHALIVAKLQLAVEHHQAGRLSPAEDLYRQVLHVAPDQSDALHLLGVISLQRGNIDSAIDLIGKAINAEPARENFHLSLGNALQAKGLFDEAVASYRQALSIKPDYADALSNMGAAFKILNRLDEASTSYRQALAINPLCAEAHSNLGNVLKNQGRLDEAIACHRQALLIKPDSAGAYSNLGNALLAQGLPDEAAASYRQALSITPDDAEVFSNLGAALLAQGLPDEAIVCCQKALSLQPDSAGAYINLGNVLQAKCRLDEAAACFRQALLIEPDEAESYCNLGNVLKDQGKLNEAEASYRQALLLKPDYADAHANLIFTLDLKVDVDAATLQAERQRWGEAHAASFLVLGAPSFTNHADPDRRLRIGYVSADFRTHSAAVSFGAMLTRFDPAAFDVFAYSNSIREDEYTRQFQQSVTQWRKIVGHTDEAVADLIRQDEIDILIDLSGHSAGNRLLVFARKPAPIQITAWGYAGGTGMKAMDVLFTDPIIVPPEEKSFYTEAVRYLPSVIGAYFPTASPEINAPRDAVASEEGSVVFGSFNRLAKLSAETLAVWSRIMQEIPESRMILKTPELEDAGTREWIAGQFRQAGIDPARLVLLGRSSWQDHVATFNLIDISLDPFPQSGGVTTLEGMTMGVPVVTLRGKTFVGRGSASILTTLGLTDWIAETPEQYVDIAVQKAKAPAALAELRRQLRPRFMASILGDNAAYVRIVEQEYRTLWREWCARRLQSGNACVDNVHEDCR